MGQRGATPPAGQVPTFKNPGSSVVSSVTDDSKCDYVVYTLKGQKIDTFLCCSVAALNTQQALQDVSVM